MAMWSTVNYLDEDVTSATSCHFDKNDFKQLYGMKTLFEISSPVEVTCCPRILSASTIDKIAFGVDKHVLLFSNDCHKLQHTYEFDSTVEAVSLSDCSQILIVGENIGILHVFYVASNFQLLGLPLVTCVEGQQSFLDIQIFNEDEGFLGLAILTSNNNIYSFLRINLKDIKLAASTENWDQSRRILIDNKFQKIPLETSYLSSYPRRLLVLKNERNLSQLCCYGSENCLLGVGFDQLGCDKQIPHFGEDGSFIRKSLTTSCGRYIVQLDDKNHMTVLSFTSFALRYVRDEVQVEDFTILERTDSNGKIVLCQLVVILLDDTGKKCLGLYGFPKFDLIYSVPLENVCHLVDCCKNQEMIYIVEQVIKENGQVQSMRVRSLLELLPETRLIQLIRKRKFKEAEAFAVQCNLNVEAVYKARVEFLVTSISPWTNRVDVNVDDVVTKIKEDLKRIKEGNFSANLCLNCAFPSALITKEMYIFALELIKRDHKSEIQEQIFRNLKKLLSFQALYYNQDNWTYWFEFSREELYKHFMDFMDTGNTKKAFLIWDLHQEEFCSNSDFQLEETLNMIPEGVPSVDLAFWLTNSFVERVITNYPYFIDNIANWIIQRAKLLEITESSDWPVNGLKLLKIIPTCCDNLGHLHTQSGMSTSITLNASLFQEISSNPRSSLYSLIKLVNQLELLLELKQKYRCTVSLAQFSQEDKMAVAFHILSCLVDSNKLPEVINTWLRVFCKEHNLVDDEVLFQYIQDVMKANHVGWWYWKEAAWEERVLRIFDFIQDPTVKRSSISSIAGLSPIPWSQGLTNVVQKEIEDTGNEDLIAQMKLSDLRIVLLKYGQRDFNLSVKANIKRLILYILKTSKETAVDDALKVVNAFDHLTKSEVYFNHCILMLQREQTEEIVDFLATLSNTDALECSKRLLSFINLTLNEPEIWEIQNQWAYLQSLVEAGIYISNHLLKITEGETEFLEQQRFLQIKRIQVEFGIYVTPEQFDSYSERISIFTETMKTILSGTFAPKILQYKDCKERKENIPFGISNLFRLGHILDLDHAEVLGHVALYMAKTGDSLKAISFCQDIVEDSSVPATVLFRIVECFLNNMSNISCKDLKGIILAFHKLTTRALAECEPAVFQDYLQICMCSSLLLHLCSIDAYCVLNQSQALKNDFYSQWRFTPVFKDHGLIIDLKNILPLLVKIMRFKDGDAVSDLIAPARQVLSYLKSKNQEGAVLEMLLMTESLFGHVLQDNDRKVLSEMKKIYKGTANILLSRIMNQRRVDFSLALGILSSLDFDESFSIITDMIRNYRKNPSRLKALTTLAIHFSERCSAGLHTEKILKIFNRACWEEQLAKLQIPIKELQETVDVPKQTAINLLEFIFKKPSLELKLVENFSKQFSLDKNDAMLLYLNALLRREIISMWGVSSMPTEEEEIKLKELLDNCSLVAEAIENEELFKKCLTIALNSANPYCYDALTFMLQQLESLDSDANLKNKIELIQFLKIYKRCASPTGYELDYWVASHPEADELPVISSKFLPYHPLISDDKWKVINSELTHKTVTLWMNVAPLFAIKADSIVYITAQNIVNAWIAKQPKLKSNVYFPADKRLLTILTDLFSKVSDLEGAVSCAFWIIKRLPSGNTKIKVAEAALRIARMWSSQESKSKADISSKLANICKRLISEQVLHEYSLENPGYLALVQEPLLLIKEILESQCYNKTFKWKTNNVMNAVTAIASTEDFNLAAVFQSIFESWMPTTDNLDSDSNDTMTFPFNIKAPDTASLWGDQEDSAKNLNRCINLLREVPSENVEPLFDQLKLAALSMRSSAKERLHALRCLFAVANEQTIKTIFGEDIPDIWDMLHQLYFLSQLEGMQLMYTLDIFCSLNKAELTKSILMSHGYNPKALVFAVSLCIYYKIWEEPIWDKVLNNMVDLNMKTILQSVLWQISNVPCLWLSSAFVKAWQFLLTQVAQEENGDVENKTPKTYLAALQCPCLHEIKLQQIAEELAVTNPLSAAVLLSLQSDNVAEIKKCLKRCQGLKMEEEKCKLLKNLSSHHVYLLSQVFVQLQNY